DVQSFGGFFTADAGFLVNDVFQFAASSELGFWRKILPSHCFAPVVSGYPTLTATAWTGSPDVRSEGSGQLIAGLTKRVTFLSHSSRYRVPKYFFSAPSSALISS